MHRYIIHSCRLFFRYRFFIALLFISPLSACGAYMAQDVSGPSRQEKPEAPPPSGALLRPELRIGLSPDYDPLAYKDPRFGLVGVEVDFANELGRLLGKSISFVELPFPQLIPALLADEVDIIMSGMTITQQRLSLVTFANPYAEISQMALVRSRDRGSFSNIDAFSNVTGKVGYVESTTGEKAARAFFPKAMLTPEPSIEGGLEALRKADIVVFIHDAPTVWRVAGRSNDRDLIGLYWPLTKEPIGWALRKDDESLRFAVNEALDRMKLLGTHREILSRWVPLRIW